MFETEIDFLLTAGLAILSWLVARLEIICRTQRKHLLLERLAHPKLYDEIFGKHE